MTHLEAIPAEEILIWNRKTVLNGQYLKLSCEGQPPDLEKQLFWDLKADLESKMTDDFDPILSLMLDHVISWLEYMDKCADEE